MNRNRIKAVLCFFSIAVLAAAADCFAADITTLDGKTYKEARVTTVEADGVHIRHRQGVTKVPFEKLPQEIQRQYNYATAKAVNPVSGDINRSGTGAPHASASFWQRFADNPALVIGPALLMGGVALIALICVLASASSEKSRVARKALQEKLSSELNDYVQAVKQANKLPTVSSQVFLKLGESAFYDCASSLYEAKAVRHYEGGRVGFRVAEGVWVGTSQGQSVSSEEQSKIDDGTLTITNTRVIFDGTQASRNLVLKSLRADWAQMMSRKDYLALNTRIEQLASEKAVSLPKALLRQACVLRAGAR